MRSRDVELQAAMASLLGAGLWAGVAVLAGLRRAPFGVIELLLLFAVLVVVPLGLNLARLLSFGGEGVGARFSSILQPVAAIAVVVSFWHRPGTVAAVLSAPWFVLGVAVAVAGVWNLYRKETRSLADLAVTVAGVDLAFASGWLAVSRAGLHPMGFQEPIVLLTAVHFHYSGFAVALIAAAALRMRDRRAVRIPILTPIVWLVLFLPAALAAGFVFSPVLRMLAAVGLAVSVPALAVCLFWIARDLRDRVARVYVRLGAVAAWVAMALAGVYAVSDYAGRAFMTMPGMASTHGVLNGIGFVLCSLLAFSIEMEAAEERLENGDVPDAVIPVVARKRPAAAVRSLPEFVAREFYDR